MASAGTSTPSGSYPVSTAIPGVQVMPPLPGGAAPVSPLLTATPPFTTPPFSTLAEGRADAGESYLAGTASMNAWPGSGRAETPRAVTLPLATAMQPPLQPTAPPALGAWRDAVMPVAPAAGQIDRTQTPTQGTDAPRLAPSPAASAVSVRATVQAKPDPGADPGPLRPQVTSVLLPGFSMRVSDPQNLPATGAATGQAVPSTQLALPRQEPLTAAFVAASFPEKPIQARSPGRTVSQLLSPPDPKDQRASTRPATLGPRIEALGNHPGPIIGMRVPAKAEAAHLPGSAPPEHMAQQAPSAPLPLAAAGLLALAMPSDQA